MALAPWLAATPYTTAMRRALTPSAPDEYAAALGRSRAAEGTPQDCAMRRLAMEHAAAHRA
eukprot:598062-Prymnesium_polylepis.1